MSTEKRRDKLPAESLMNIGPKSALWLQEIGIENRADLEAMGPVLAYRILKDRFPQVSLNMLYALVGALSGKRWDEFTEEEKIRLRREA